MWRFIFQNLWFKLVALLMAMLLWFHVATDKVYEYTRIFRLEILNIPSNLILAEKVPDQVEVRLRGRGKEILKLLLSERQTVKIEAKEFKSGETDYSIKPNQIPIPEGLELQATDILFPQDIKIKLDYLTKKKVEVRPEVKVFPADGFVQAGELRYTPREVMISGPKRQVMDVEVIHTREKIIGNAEKPVSDQVDLALPPGYNLSLLPPKISISADIQKAAEKQIFDLPVQVINVSKYRETELQPDRIRITIFGAEGLLSQTGPDKIKVSVDCTNAKKKEAVKLPVLVELPPDVSLRRAEPDSIDVLVK